VQPWRAFQRRKEFPVCILIYRIKGHALISPGTGRGRTLQIVEIDRDFTAADTEANMVFSYLVY
jgi:hypothetical protein